MAEIAQCTNACLNTAGLGGVYSSIQEARIKKAKLFFEDRQLFKAPSCQSAKQVGPLWWTHFLNVTFSGNQSGLSRLFEATNTGGLLKYLLMYAIFFGRLSIINNLHLQKYYYSQLLEKI